jgi:hypothetical protein
MEARVRRHGRYRLLLGLLVAVALSPAEARVMADRDLVPQAIPVQYYRGWQPGMGGGTGQGRGQLCAQLQRERDELRAAMDQSGPRRRERLQQRVWELRDQYQRACVGS